ncbi:MAG: radical SAM protein [Syntrophobacteria bacterium]
MFRTPQKPPESEKAYQANPSRTCSVRIFGPVPSRRLGRSLGVDLVPPKTCTYNCIYCESGTTTHLTVERFSPYTVAEIIDELDYHLAHSSSAPEIITLSGAGEPTLHAGIGELIYRIKGLTSLPVAVITNGSLLCLPEVRQEIAQADLVLPSLDAATDEVFRRINRPHCSLDLVEIIAGLLKFRRHFSGQIWLEILLVQGVNDVAPELEALRNVVEKLQPERLQLNTVDRPPQVPWAKPVSRTRLHEIAGFFGTPVEIISRFDRRPAEHHTPEDLEGRIIQMIRRRPCTKEQISAALGVELSEVAILLEAMTSSGHIKRRRHQGSHFYTCADA